MPSAHRVRGGADHHVDQMGRHRLEGLGVWAAHAFVRGRAPPDALCIGRLERHHARGDVAQRRDAAGMMWQRARGAHVRVVHVPLGAVWGIGRGFVFERRGLWPYRHFTRVLASRRHSPRTRRRSGGR